MSKTKLTIIIVLFVLFLSVYLVNNIPSIVFPVAFGFKLPQYSKKAEVRESRLGGATTWVRFEINGTDFEQLTKSVIENGYSDWSVITQGYAYGDFYIEPDAEADVLLAQKPYPSGGGSIYMLFYNRKAGVVDAVAFFN